MNPEYLLDGYRIQFQRVIDHETARRKLLMWSLSTPIWEAGKTTGMHCERNIRLVSSILWEV